MENLDNETIVNIKKTFAQYRKLSEDAMNRLTDEEFFFRPAEESNSCAILVAHVAGNLKSRFTEFLFEDGEKPWRERDAEFEPVGVQRADLMQAWQDGWQILEDVLSKLTGEQLLHIVYIRKEPHSVLAALLRQIAHYSYHIGQIVYLARYIKGEEWTSLSIAKNKSKEYNQQKMS